ncbi:MAG: transporter substrate-binding domain-containing protein [Pseudomonas sp.]|uniref:substrate-binding periplasmic protein n=1 Tax=Pseudomonas sp. TaxID=306 RepID=UPI0033956031
MGVLASLCCWLAAQAGPLRLYTEEYPPLNFSRDGQADGFSTEVVREILRGTGQQAQILVVPWARGYRQAQTQPDTGLFVTMRTRERERLFQWVGPLTVNTTSFYALKGSALRLAHLDDARDAGDIAVPRDWYSHQLLEAEAFTNLYPVADPEQMVRMLKLGRVRLIAVDDLSLPALLASGGLRPEDVQLLLTFVRTHSYIAFSPQTDGRLIERWQAELDRMKADGRFAVIYQRWLPGHELPGAGGIGEQLRR